jgi:hypothetical protein
MYGKDVMRLLSLQFSTHFMNLVCLVSVMMECLEYETCAFPLCADE